MKFLKKFRKSPNFWPLIIVFFFAVLAGRSLIFESGYFNMHDDLQMMRQLEMEKCFLDGQIPCRWVPDMGYGYGFPLFNFYPPLPYLVGEVFRIFGASFVVTAKLTFALSFIASGIGMYLLAKDFFGRFGGVLSSIFYIWAPYHAVDVYVRGAMNEAWALIWFPFIFWAGYRLIKEKKDLAKWIIGLALSWFGLLTSHNLMVLIFTPIFGLWILIHLWRENSWRKIPQLLLSGLLAFGLAAFFTLPAVLENKLTHIESVLIGYYDYTAHFVSIKQLLFSRFWGYGPSVWGVTDDRMSFQVGHLHWGISLVLGGMAGIKLLSLRKEKKNLLKELKKDNLLLIIIFLFFVGWLTTFMAHPRSTPIWLVFSQLRLVQFPWRFLALVIFAFSFLVGALPGMLEKAKISKKFLTKAFLSYFQLIITTFLALALMFLGWNYFKPENGKMGPLTDEGKFTGAAWELQQTAGIYDYLPITADVAPTAPRGVLAEIWDGMEGEGEISKMEEGTYWAKFNANIESEKAIVRINIFKFPDWRVTIDGQEVNVLFDKEWGRMMVEVPQGEHVVYAQLYNTWPRTVGNLISLVSWAGLITFPYWRRKKK